MALFGSKNKTAGEVSKKKVETAAKTVKAERSVAAPSSVTVGTHADSIIRPRVTEKSGLLSQGGVYTFEISTNANKNSVASAVKALYKVSPVKVAIINTPSKNVFVRGRRGVVPGARKAMVTLKKGDKIDFV